MTRSKTPVTPARLLQTMRETRSRTLALAEGIADEQIADEPFIFDNVGNLGWRTAR